MNELLPSAPDVTVQIAHMGGAGGVEAFRKLPLTDAEFRTIETNVAPYLR